uniref:Uncharacterized protein n=1 Tax=Vitis vinifera TaxID=29760 RepID=A5C2G9_VITVI|nr:hypothetical protein VITISV_008163 [Vitis vinifera]
MSSWGIRMELLQIATRDIAHSTSDRIFHIRCLTPDGRRGRFNFPDQTCSDLLIALTRRASAAANSDFRDSLARQTLAICRIHFRP